MLDFLKRANVVGLDIGSNSVKLVRLRETPKGIQLLNFDMGVLPPDAIVEGSLMNFTAVVEKIREMVKINGLSGCDAAIAISGNSVIIKKISLPEMTQEELDESIQWEAEQYIPFDIKDVNVDVQILNPKASHGQMDVLLVAAKKDVIDDYLTVAIEGGVNPVVIDVAAFSINNMFEMNYGFPPAETLTIINIGAQTTNINVISDGIIAFTRDISLGGKILTEEIQKQLNVSWDEAEQFKTGIGGSVSSSTIAREVTKLSERVSETIATEIQRSLDFFVATSAHTEISRCYLCGGSAQMPAMIRALEKRMEVPIELINPFKNIFINPAKFDLDLLQRIAPQASSAVGLGLRKKNDWL